MQATIPWTAPRVALLRQYCAESLSYRIIGEKLGISKNAAISKARRIGLGSIDPEEIRRRARVAKRKKRLPTIHTDAPAQVAPPAPQRKPRPKPLVAKCKPIHFMDLPAGQCAFPLWPPDARIGECCGALIWKGNYCRAHYEHTHVKMSKAEADRTLDRVVAVNMGRTQHFNSRILATR